MELSLLCFKENGSYRNIVWYAYIKATMLVWYVQNFIMIWLKHMQNLSNETANSIEVWLVAQKKGYTHNSRNVDKEDMISVFG